MSLSRKTVTSQEQSQPAILPRQYLATCWNAISVIDHDVSPLWGFLHLPSPLQPHPHHSRPFPDEDTSALLLWPGLATQPTSAVELLLPTDGGCALVSVHEKENSNITILSAFNTFERHSSVYR